MSQNITVIVAEECQYQVLQNKMLSVTYHVTGKTHKSQGRQWKIEIHVVTR